MTQLNDKERAALMADMKSFDEQMPCVGIFWYDPEEHSFFGVHKKEVTPKMVEEARAKGVDVINYPIKFTGDYTHVLRGRVAWNVNKFIVLVGHWAEPVQEELSQLIEDTFHLPYFEFVYDQPMEQREASQACLGYPE